MQPTESKLLGTTTDTSSHESDDEQDADWD